jgi:hypothetical protein
MGGSGPSAPSAVELMKDVQGAPIYILNMDANKVIPYLLANKVPGDNATAISQDIALKSVESIAGILDLIPGLEAVGGVLSVISGLLGLMSGVNEEVVQNISRSIAQNFIADHYTGIRANLNKVNDNIRLNRLDLAY